MVFIYIYTYIYVFRQLSVSIDTTFIIYVQYLFINFLIYCVFIYFHSRALQYILTQRYWIAHNVTLYRCHQTVSLSLCLSVSLSARRGRGAECQRTEHLFTT